MKTLVVAGTFDENGGNKSGFISKLFCSYPEEIVMINGGHYDLLADILYSVDKFDVVYWLANVPNNFPKLRNVKEMNSKCILITSKRNDNEKYSFEELINRSLKLKANLTLEFSKENNLFNIRAFDPLGVLWCNKTTDYKKAMEKVYNRLKELITFTRQNCIMTNENIDFHIEEKFLGIIQEKAKIFHELIQPAVVVERFLGNVSFRCVHGFPSFRKDDCIVVSRRNVDKNGMKQEDFVPVKFIEDKLFVYSNNKPSVDTPIQIRLYQNLSSINYMLHAHVYIKDAPFTNIPIPCGALEEADHILTTIKKYNIDINNNFCINLIGHGSLVFAKDLNYFNQIIYEKRNVPELL